MKIIKLRSGDVVKEYKDELTWEVESCRVSRVVNIPAHEVVQPGVD